MDDNKLLKIILQDLQKLNEKKKADGMRSVKKGADDNPNVTKMDFLPNKVLDKIAKEKNETKGEECSACGHIAKGDDSNCEMCNEPLSTNNKKLDEKKRKKKKQVKHDPNYGAPEGSKRDAQLDRARKAYQRGDIETAARIRRNMEKKEREKPGFKNKPRPDTKKESVEMSESILRKVIRGVLAEKLSKKTKATLKKKAEKRGLTPGSVYAEYRKGLAAWATSGSRKGMSQHQWAHARVNSANPSKSWAVVKKAKKKKK